MGTIDVYRITDQLDNPTLEVVVARLESRGKHPRFRAMMQQYMDAMDIDAAHAVLDLGSGTGVAARAIARRSRFAGKITAVDVSPYLIAAAKRFATEEGLDEAIKFTVADSHALDLPDREFDAVIAHTLLSHLDDPLVVLKEAVRVLRPGGKLGIFDGDYASLTFTGDDHAAADAFDRAIIDAIVTQPRVMRRMPELLHEVGLVLNASFSHVVADIGKADFWAPAIQSFVRLLPKAGAMSEADASAWAAMMTRRSAEDTFFAASNFYSYVAQRPNASSYRE